MTSLRMERRMGDTAMRLYKNSRIYDTYPCRLKPGNIHQGGTLLSKPGSILRMSEHTINLVDGDEHDSVVALFEAQLLEHDIVTGRDDLKSAVQTLVADPRYGFMLVASDVDGEPVGAAYASCLLSLEHGGISGWLEELYVLPQWRNLGIGSQLIAAVVAHARNLGWRAIDLEIESSHHRAISLYARHQFKPLSRTRYVRPLRDEA